MDWKQFFASIIASVAWPLAIVGSLLIFRVQISRLLSQIKKFAAGGVNFELSEQIENVVSAGQALEAEQAQNSSREHSLDDSTLELAKRFPGAAFLQSFKKLESVILQIRGKLPDNKPNRYLGEVVQYLKAKGFISESAVDLFRQLQKTRNTVVHGDVAEMSPGEAIELIGQIRLLEDLMYVVLHQIPKPTERI